MARRPSGNTSTTQAQIVNAISRQRGINETMLARGGSQGTSGRVRKLFRCTILAVDATATPVTYRVQVLSGASDNTINWIVGGASAPYSVLGTSDAAQFSAGDKAVLMMEPGEPPTLISGGAGGSGAATAIFLNVLQVTAAGA